MGENPKQRRMETPCQIVGNVKIGELLPQSGEF